MGRRTARLIFTVLALLTVGLAGSAAASAQLRWTGALLHDTAGSGPALTALACPSATLCVAVDAAGGAVAFNPSAPAPQTPVTIDTTLVTDVSCSSAARCVAVDAGGREVTFNPMDLGAAVATAVDPGEILFSVSCPPGGSACAAVDGAGNEVWFAPDAPGGAKPRSLTNAGALTGVSCPVVAAGHAPTCSAIDTVRQTIGFNPQTGNITSESSSGGSGTTAPTLTAISCPDTTTCVVFDSRGSVTVQAGSTTSSAIDPGRAIFGADCPGAKQCTLIDDAGAEVTFTPGSSGARNVIDAGATLTSVVCPTSSLCVTVDSAGRAISFNPASPAAASIALVDAVQSLSAVACPSASQCTGADEAGNEITFDPAAATAIASAPVDPGAPIYAIACPALTQCTSVDASGKETTFDPRSRAAATPVALVNHHQLLAISCPSSSQCTAVDDDQYEVTFDPQAPTTGRYGLLNTPAGTDITSVACPTQGQCTAVDGIGEEVTFNPQNPQNAKPSAVLSTGAVGVACPTTTLCIALGASGMRATFNPLAPRQVSTSVLERSQLSALNCPGATYCVAVDADGRALEFDPGGAGATGSIPVSGDPLSAVACTSAAQCVAVNSAGVVFAGSGVVPPIPVSIRPPRIAGAARQGATLHEVHGTWSGRPTSYRLQWQRCSHAGVCRPIPGATGASYRLARADAGSAVRVLEQAADPGGAGATVASARTALVVGSPAPPTVSSVTLAGVGRGRPRLSLTVRADRWGPTLRTVELLLPRSITFATDARGGARRSTTTMPGLSLRVTGPHVGFSSRPAGRRLTLRLTRPVSRMRLLFAFPSLRVARELIQGVRRHSKTKLQLIVAVSAAHHRVLPKAATVTLRG